MEVMEIKKEWLDDLGISGNAGNAAMDLLATQDHKYLRDLKMNLKSVLSSEHLTQKEATLLAYAVAVNERSEALMHYFSGKAQSFGANQDELAEMAAVASMLSVNNVLYRFRHFVSNEKYSTLPARLRMGVMMNPVTGKEFFELASLAVSAVNGCEMCVGSHEQSVRELGTAEERVFDAIRLTSVIVGLSKII